MKKLGMLLIGFLFSYHLIALDTSISYATFNSPSKPYVEVYLHVVGQSVTFEAIDSLNKQAVLEVVILFKKGEEIVKFDKYRLNSPLAKEWVDFIDLKRYALENGSYQLEVSVQDISKPENAKTYKAPLEVNYDGTKLMQSDLQLLSSYEVAKEENVFVKNGLYLEPLPFNFYSKRYADLLFYTEVYNTDKQDLGDFYNIRYTIEQVKGNGERMTMKLGHKSRKVKPIDIVVIQMDIAKLASGNYDLIVEVRGKGNELLSTRKVFFQRSNPYLKMETLKEAPIEEEFVSTLTEEELEYSLRAIGMNLPDGDVDLVNLMLKNDEIDAQRRYLFSYWAQYSPSNPHESYKKYMEVAKAVDRTYESGFRHGFESDRGWIFMKYGKPHDIVTMEQEPTAPPYEIWFYNDIPRTSQRNVKFLFYNPSLSVGAYELLHSTCRGEISNLDWENVLYKDEPAAPNGERGGTQIMKNARNYFNDF